MKEIGKLECPKKGGDMCLLQMGMGVKDRQRDWKKMKREREEFRVERYQIISRMKTVCAIVVALFHWLTLQWGGE